MTVQGWLQIAFYVVVLTALTPLLGAYMARVYQGEPVLARARPRTARAPHLPRCSAAGPAVEQDWKSYARTMVVFSALFWLVALRDPAHAGTSTRSTPRASTPAPWDVTFNTTSSFITNTNWQYYGGETTLSYFSQMAGLAVQNFVSAAVGMAVLAAVIRGFASRGSKDLGNFWRDLTRTLLYILLPLAFVGALILVSQGVIQTFSGYVGLDTLTGGRPDARARPGRVADLDQAARHQRRRLLQRQLGDAVREPDRVLELRRGALHPPDPRRAHGHLRPHGRQPPPGLGPVRGDGGDDGRRHRGRLRRRAERLPGPAATQASRPPPATAPRAATSRARSSATASSPAPSGRLSPPTPPTARSTPRTTPTPASAAPCRWST